jgi:hypothetical protein
MSLFLATQDEARDNVLYGTSGEDQAVLAIGTKRMGAIGTLTVKSIDWRQGWVHWEEDRAAVSIYYYLTHMWEP